MDELARRRTETNSRIEKLREELSAAEGILGGNACVYATGSFGRREASGHSDLDLFIVGKRNGVVGRQGFEGSALKRLDEIRVKADLIEITHKFGIPEFDGDGRYLVHYSVHELTETLGRPEDDASNTFTARLLLLLESTPILGTEAYNDIIDEVIAAYWGDYEKHKNDFMPAFLANDIIRLWRTLCVNYEARTERQPEEKRLKRKAKNFKLKYSRMLTCYSALLYLLSVFSQKNTVPPNDVTQMARLTPTQRLESIRDNSGLSEAHPAVSDLLSLYDNFLARSNVAEAELIELFANRDTSQAFFRDAARFGDSMFEALTQIGKSNRFHRLLVV